MRYLPIITALWLLSCGAALAVDAVPAAAYFPVLPFDAPPDAAPQLVPVASNHPIDAPPPGVTRAIIVIHDTGRDAAGAAATMSALAGAANATTMIVAPQFLLPSDLARFADHLPDHGKNFATWPITGWPAGDDAATVAGHKSISSFTVVDLLLMYLADRGRFPNLRGVTLAGFSAGADFTQRYAVFGIASAMLAQQNIDMRYVVADASSFLYLTANRPRPADKSDGGKNENRGFAPPDAAVCPDFNAYPYGLERLNPYARRVGVNQAKMDYATRRIVYLNAAAPDPLPDNGCAALAQGGDGAARAASYQTYLESLYGEAAAQTQSFVRVKDAKADPVGLFGSNCGMAALFGDGICAP